MRGILTDEQTKILSKFLSGIDFKNEKNNLTIYALDRIMPAILSSLFTIYSTISSSFIYDYSEILYQSSFFIIALFTGSIIYYPTFKVLSKSRKIIGFKVYRQVSEYKNNSDILDDYKLIYRNNVKNAIDSTFSELSEFVFVILFPGGVSDILIGIAESTSGIGINGMNQMVTGIILVIFSVIFLLNTVRRHKAIGRKKMAQNYIKINTIIHDVQKTLDSKHNLTYYFKEDETVTR